MDDTPLESPGAAGSGLSAARQAVHRLNQPLTALMGYAELLAGRLPPGSPERRYVERILAESERLAEMIKALDIAEN
jgi:signal transduction histidine kinase